MNITLCFTGHRRLPSDRIPMISDQLDQVIAQAYYQGYRRFLCGGALGFDTLAAQRTLAFRETHPDVRLCLYVPCKDQADRWSAVDRQIYNSILRQVNEDDIHILFPKYQPGCMQQRNQKMVDQSSLCICWLYSFRGGTAYTVRYALQKKLEIINLAMNDLQRDLTLRENECKYTYIFLSANKNAGTVTLLPLSARKLRQKNTRNSC